MIERQNGRRGIHSPRLNGLLVLLLALGGIFFVSGTAHSAVKKPRPRHHHPVKHRPKPRHRQRPRASNMLVDYPHVMLIVMENASFSDILGNPSAPYINSVAQESLVATNSYAKTHPSLPNYLELVSGQTFLSQGTGADCTPSDCGAMAGSNLGDQLTVSGIPWEAFMGGMPSVCDLMDGDVATGYAVRHDPFVYFPQLVASAGCLNILPESEMQAQLNALSPPAFVFLSPAVCDDGGGDSPCSTLSSADQYLATTIPMIESTKWYQQGGTIILTWDEGRSDSGQGGDSGGNVPTLLISSTPGLQGNYNGYVDTAGILRTVESEYHLPYLGDAADPSSGSLPITGLSAG